MATDGTGATFDQARRVQATRLLLETREGNKEAVDLLFPLVYNEMRQIAHQKLKFERNGHTLDTTALVHETYFKLINHDDVEWQSRSHFLAVAAIAMRRILINYAEKRNAVKRGGEFQRADSRIESGETESPQLSMSTEAPQLAMSDAMADELLALDDALKRMETFNERGSRVVEYHYFGGLTWKEIADVMGIAPITVRRSWNVAKLWLRKELDQPGFESAAGHHPVFSE